jgi:hypothetical protein
MGLPVIPFIVGAAAGSVATYLYRDKAAREQWLKTVEAWYAGLASGWRRETPVERAAEKAAEVAEEAVQTAEEAVDTAREAAEQAGEQAAEDLRDRGPDSHPGTQH